MKDYFKNIIYIIIGFLIVLGSLSFKHPDLSEKIIDSEIKENSKSKFFNQKNITDGPYIFYENENIVVKWIYRNRLIEKNIHDNNFNVIKRKFGFEFNPEWIEQCNTDSINYIQNYSEVDNLIAISDVHGQYDILVKLLRKHHVIDKNFNWIFGNGHLVVLGDIFDRGPKVTEALWLIYRLEQQAKENGGKVHVLLGNHELMIFNNDLRYIHEKYVKSAQLMATTYDKLYSENSFLGKWLRKKPVIVSINDMLFVHAGISTEFINKGFTQKNANSIFNENIVGKTWDTILSDSTLSFMMGSKGPMWFRGYFINDKLNEIQIDNILKYFNKNRILVGHTSLPNISLLYHGKVLGIDSNIKEGDYGELLIYEKGVLYRGTLQGTRIKF